MAKGLTRGSCPLFIHHVSLYRKKNENKKEVRKLHFGLKPNTHHLPGCNQNICYSLDHLNKFLINWRTFTDHVYNPTTSVTMVLVCVRKLSIVGVGQYLDGGPACKDLEQVFCRSQFCRDEYLLEITALNYNVVISKTWKKNALFQTNPLKYYIF